jgi:Domain of unknown function (DUF4277)
LSFVREIPDQSSVSTYADRYEVDVKEPTMAADEPYTLSREHLGALPVINFFLARMGVAEHLATYLPADDARLRLTPAAVIALVVRNIVAGHRPVYALGEWATPYDPPAVLGLWPGDAEALNDDRVGRMLERLFDADRSR